MHKSAFSHLKLQNIILIIQHGQMNVFLNTFPIAIIRQLGIGTISGDYSIFAGNKSEIDNTPVVAQHLKRVTGLQSTGNIRNFRYIVAQLPDAFQIRRFELAFFCAIAPVTASSTAANMVMKYFFFMFVYIWLTYRHLTVTNISIYFEIITIYQ